MIAHYRFEKIHPFGDGNGRIGRLLMNHILWFAGYPVLVIEYKDRNKCYTALSREEGGFISYFFKTYLKVHGENGIPSFISVILRIDVILIMVLVYCRVCLRTD